MEEPGPSELNAANHGPGLEIGKDRLSLRYTGDGRHSNDVGAIQSNRPVPAKQLLFYFELTVLEQGDAGRIGIGYSDKDFKVTRQPGWEPHSYGYHGDDGKRYGNGEKGADYGPKFGTGDVVGACLHFGRQEIFFTKNGTRLKTAFRNVTGHLFPTVGLHSKGEHVAINLGQAPFKFDLEGLIIEEREQEAAALQRMPVAAGDVHQLVRGYLLFNGYGDTLVAFDAAAGAEGIAQPMCEGDEEGAMAATLQTRQAVRRAVMAGQIPAAMELLQQQCPLLQGSAAADDVRFHMSCQQYIELIREGRVSDAMQFAQTVLAGLQPGGQRDAALREVVALIAYERPEASPLARLLALSQREQVADVVNAAILQAATSGPTSNGDAPPAASSPRQSCLELLLRQLVAARAALREEQGGLGEAFSLSDHLPAAPARAMSM